MIRAGDSIVKPVIGEWFVLELTTGARPGATMGRAFGCRPTYTAAAGTPALA
jgi:hypothetical protein